MPATYFTEAVLVAAAGALGVLGREVVGLWKGRPSAADRKKTESEAAQNAAGAAADLIELAMKASGHSVERLLSQIDDLERTVQELKDSHAECERKAQEQGREIEQLRAARREDRQMIDSLLRQLKDPNATLPGGALAGAVIELAGGAAKVTRARRTPK